MSRAMNRSSGIRVGFMVAVTALCVCCSTAAQRKEQRIRDNNRVAVSTFNACIRAVYESTDYAPLRVHAPAPSSQPTLEQLTDVRLATDDEIRAIFAVHPRLNECRQHELDRLYQETPTFVPIMASAYSHGEEVLIELIQKQVTWGAYLRQMKTIQEDSRAQLVLEGDRIDANLERSHENELARRQIAANAIAQFVETAAEINALNRPVVTTCNAYGNSATCVTR